MTAPCDARARVCVCLAHRTRWSGWLLVFGPSRRCDAATMARLTSARASSPPDSGTSSEAREQISQGKTRDGHSIHPPHIRPASPDDMGLRVFVPSRPPALRLVCGSYSSGRSFACGFLPTTRHHVAVAVRLGVPVIKVPRGLAPPRHFPIRFRVSVDSAVMALRAMPGAHGTMAGVRPAILKSCCCRCG